MTSKQKKDNNSESSFGMYIENVEERRQCAMGKSREGRVKEEEEEEEEKEEDEKSRMRRKKWRSRKLWEK